MSRMPRAVTSVTLRVNTADARTASQASASQPCPAIMISSKPNMYCLQTGCAVKWTATQERNINRDYPLSPATPEMADDYVSQTYLQFLWLPESIMPLRYLAKTLLRPWPRPLPSEAATTSHPLHTLLRPLLLTPRSSADKYHTRIAQILSEEPSATDAEESMVWFVLRYQKPSCDSETSEDQSHDLEESRTQEWLERMEQREVQIQIIFHFLLLSLPQPCEPDEEPQSFNPFPTSPSPKKRKRKTRDIERGLTTSYLEECLEFFMDKLSMWQLMASLDAVDRKREEEKGPSKESIRGTTNNRDWMQTFCQDVVEPSFRDTLPDMCNLLRAKVFPNSPFSDSSDTSSTPPGSPRIEPKRMKSSSSAKLSRVDSLSSQPGSSKNGQTRLKMKLERTRSRSLSLSLEEERERSRSVNLGGDNMRKKVLVREVSMSTVFRAKDKGKSKDKEKAPVARQRPAATEANRRKETKAVGVTLVEATPVKSKANMSRTQTQRMQSRNQSQPVLPRPAFQTRSTSERDLLQLELEGEEDEEDCDQWNLPSSPDVSLLSSEGSSMDSGRKSGRTLVQGTPTKSGRRG